MTPSIEALKTVHFSRLFDEDFFHIVMDNNPCWVFVKNERSEFVYANKALLSVLPPHKRDNLIGKTFVEDFTPEQAEVYLEEDRRAFERGNSEIIEEITDYTGKTTTLLTRKTCFTAKNGERLMLAISTDITEHAARQRELVQTNNMLENFAAVAAHDLRSPLATYTSLLELILLDQENVLSSKTKQYLDMMHDSALRLTNHITGLLSTYKASYANSVNRSAVDLNILFEQVRFNLDTLINSCEAKVMSNRLPTLDVDENLFRHMLLNLIENSLKYRSPQRRPIVIVKHETRGNTHLFSIEDNGIGIKPSQEQKVFQLYEQIDGSEKSGVGLGLSLCRRIAQLHNGKMWIDHKYTKGCRICFSVQT